MHGRSDPVPAALRVCPAAINTKWNGEFAVLAVVNYTYASLMLARLVEMGEVTGPALHSAYTKIRNCETHDHSFCVYRLHVSSSSFDHFPSAICHLL